MKINYLVNENLKNFDSKTEKVKTLRKENKKKESLELLRYQAECEVLVSMLYRQPWPCRKAQVLKYELGYVIFAT